MIAEYKRSKSLVVLDRPLKKLPAKKFYVKNFNKPSLFYKLLAISNKSTSVIYGYFYYRARPVQVVFVGIRRVLLLLLVFATK